MSDNDELNHKGLDRLIKAFSGDMPVAQVGILGNNSARKDGGSNVEIGAKHELGLDGMPQRSWLRVPLMDHLLQFMEKGGAFTDDVLKAVIAEGSIVAWTRKVGITAEAVVAEGFATGGFGKWAAWRGGYKSRTGNILVDSQQLRNSVSSRVVEK